MLRPTAIWPRSADPSDPAPAWAGGRSWSPSAHWPASPGSACGLPRSDSRGFRRPAAPVGPGARRTTGAAGSLGRHPARKPTRPSQRGRHERRDGPGQDQAADSAGRRGHGRASESQRTMRWTLTRSRSGGVNGFRVRMRSWMRWHRFSTDRGPEVRSCCGSSWTRRSASGRGSRAAEPDGRHRGISRADQRRRHRADPRCRGRRPGPGPRPGEVSRRDSGSDLAGLLLQSGLGGATDLGSARRHP